jgi:predicted transcriptional regulator
MKERLSVYLDPHVMRSLIDYADRRGKSKSLIAEAAIASFLSPDAAERQEATLARRLDRLVRQTTERLERDVGIAIRSGGRMALRLGDPDLSSLDNLDQTSSRARARGSHASRRAPGRRTAHVRA